MALREGMGKRMENIIKKQGICVLAALACATLIMGGGAVLASEEEAARTADIAILYTGDVHCAVDDNIGYAGLSAYKKSLEENGDEVLLVDTGDAIQGAAIGSFSEGADIIEIMNTVGYDAMALGNHEFDYGGPARLAELSEMADFPFLSVNLTSRETGESIYPAYTILEADGQKIAFVGVSTPETLTASTPAYFMNEDGEFIYDFGADSTGEKFYGMVQTAVDSARAEGADYVIVLAHLGIIATSSPYTSTELIENTSGIDVVLDGHSHSVIPCERVTNKDGEKVLLSSTGSKLENIGLLYIEKDGNLSTGLVSEVSDTDQEITDLLTQILAKYEEQLAEKVGTLENTLVTSDPETGEWIIRTYETNLGDFVADAYRAAGDSDIAFINGGGIRTELAAGDVTYRDVLEVNPFGNLLCKVSMSGQTILDALEYSVSHWPEADGGFLQVSGISFTVDASVDSPVEVDDDGLYVGINGDRRVKDVMVGDEPLDPEKEYSVVSINYILKNYGNGYNMFSDSEMLMDEFILDADALTDYINSGYDAADYADPLGQGRITVVDGAETAGTEEATEAVTEEAAEAVTEEAAEAGTEEAAEAVTEEATEAGTEAATEAGTADAAAETWTALEKVPLEDVTIEAVVEANRIDVILRNYQNAMEKKDGEIVKYISAAGSYGEYEGECYIFRGNRGYGVEADGDYYGMVISELYYEEYGRNTDYISLSAGVTLEEHQQELTDNGDGTYTLETTLPAEAFDEWLDEYSEYEDGTYLECAYTLDACTLAVKSVCEHIFDAEGNEVEVLDYTTEYNVEEPEKIAELEERMADTEDQRILHVVENPGTDQERTYTVYAHNGEGIYFYVPYSCDVYADEACTEQADLSDRSCWNGERTVYIGAA